MKNLLEVGVKSNNTTTFVGKNPKLLDDPSFTVYLVDNLGEITEADVVNILAYFSNLVKTHNVRLAFEDDGSTGYGVVTSYMGQEIIYVATCFLLSESTNGYCYLGIIPMSLYDENITDDSQGLFIMIPQSEH